MGKNNKPKRRKQSLIQTVKKFVRLGAYFAPEIGGALASDKSPVALADAILAKSGFKISDGTWSFQRAAFAWAPGLTFDIVDKGQAMAKRFLQGV